jgi:hypothetical protein
MELFMNILIGILFIIVGLTGILRPSFFYKSELLTPQQIERNKRIWNRGGIGLVILGFVELATLFFWK